MLVVTRKNNESVVILDSDGIVIAKIQLVKSTQGKAQIGVEAPADVKVLREELLGTEALPYRGNL